MFAHNLISMSTLDKKGYQGEWGSGSLSVKMKGGDIIMVGIGKGRMYKVDVLYDDWVTVGSAKSHGKAVDIYTWHRRLGHVSIPRILCMANKNLIEGLHITSRTYVNLAYTERQSDDHSTRTWRTRQRS